MWLFFIFEVMLFLSAAFLVGWVACYTPKNARLAGISLSSPKAEQLNQKKWVDRNDKIAPLFECDSSQIKIVSYNVLGPMHGESMKHDYAPVGVTKWTRRRDKLLEELRSLSPDILCMQEISEKGLKETFIPGLKQIGMDCCAYAPGRDDTAKGKFGHKGIGCAIFIKSSKFAVVDSKRLYLRYLVFKKNIRFHVGHAWFAMFVLSCPHYIEIMHLLSTPNRAAFSLMWRGSPIPWQSLFYNWKMLPSTTCLFWYATSHELGCQLFWFIALACIFRTHITLIYITSQHNAPRFENKLYSYVLHHFCYLIASMCIGWHITLHQFVLHHFSCHIARIWIGSHA